jgi:predicted  nucleic acid-binding Zn-ribbon protein
MAFRQIKSPALADKAVINTKLDESAVQGQSTLTGMINPSDCFTLLYDVGSDSLKKITADAFFSSFSTDDLQEGDNQYFTPERAQAAVAQDIADAVAVETSRATVAEQLLQANINAEASTRAQADVTLQANITAEETRAKLREDSIEAASQSADGVLSGRIDDILSNTDSAAIDSFVEVIKAFEDADDVLSASIIANSSAITTEVARAIAAETANSNAIATETSRATAAEVAITSLLTAEEIARIAADAALDARLTTEEATSVSLQSQITVEVNRATAAESVLTQDLADEVTRATGAEAANAQNLQDEIVARATADTQVRTDLGADIVTAQNAAQSHAEAQDTLMIGDATVDGSASNTITDRIASSKSGAETVASADAAAKVLVEKTRAETTESNLQSQITSNDGDITALQTADSTETAARIAGDSNLQSQIDFITSNTDSAALDSLTEIVSAFQNADSDMSALVSSNTTAISTEKARAEAAEGVLQTNINTEASTRAIADTGLQSQIDNITLDYIGRDSDTLASAKSYTDQEADAHQAAAESHADAQDTALIGDASVNGTVGNTVTARIATAKSESTAYTDAQVASEAATRLAADDALSLRTTVLEGEMDTVESLAAQNEIDLRAEEVARHSGDSDLQGQIIAETARAIGAEGTLTSNLATEVARATGAEAVNAAAVVTEKNRAVAVEAGLRTDVNTNTVNISANLGAINTERTRALAAESALSTRVDGVITDYTAADSDIQTLISSEVTRATGIEAGLRTDVDQNASDISDADSDILALQVLQSADHLDNQAQITAEVNRATAAEGVNAAAVVTEKNRAEGIEAGLRTDVDSVQSQVTANDSDILALQNLQTTDITDLQDQIDAEVLRATGIEGGIRTDLTTLEGRVDYIVSNDDGAALDSLTEIVSAFQDADSDLTGVISANSGRLTTVEGRATSLETRSTDLEARATAVEGRATSLETEQVVQNGRLNVNESDIDDLETKQGSATLATVATNVSDAINEIHGELDVEAGNVDVLQSEMDVAEGRLDGHDSDFTAIQGRATSVEGRATVLESRATALETKQGSATLATVATNVSDAINELHGEVDTETAKVATLETEMDTVEGRATALETRASALETEQGLQGGRLTVNEGDIDALESKIGSSSETLDTAAQTLTGAINEVHGETDTNTSGLAAAVARADADSDALATEILDRTAADTLIRTDLAAFRTTDQADYTARDAVVLASAQTYAESEADDAEAAAKIYADGIVASEATLRENADTVLDGKITTEATARQNADNALDSRATVLETEMSATQLAAGVNADGTYATPSGTNYIDLSTSLADADKKLDTAIKSADASRIAGDVNLQSQLDAEIARATGAEGVLTSDLATEVARATAAEAANGVLISTNAASIATESSRAQGVEGSLQTQIDFITSNTDSAALDSLTEIVAAFQSADGTLTGLINQNVTDISTNASGLAQEITDRIAGDNAVRGEFATADAGLQTQIDGLVSKSGDSMTGVLAMGGNKVSGVATGTDTADAVNKGQMDAGLAAQHISQFSTDDLSEGDNEYFTPARARASIAVTDVDGEGNVSYDNTSGVLSVSTGKAFVELEDVVDADLVNKNGFVARVKTDGSGIELVNPAQLSFNDSRRQVISGDGAQTMFALDFYTLESNAMVFVGGVIQDPSVHYSIDATNQQITFNAALPVGTQAVVIAQSTNSVGVLDPKSVGLETLADNIKVFEQGNDIIAGTSATVVSTFNKAVYRSAKYVVTVESGGEFETRECLVIHDGSNAYITEYGIIFTGSSLLGDTDVRITGSSVELLYTSVSAGAVVSVSSTYVDV